MLSKKFQIEFLNKIKNLFMSKFSSMVKVDTVSEPSKEEVDLDLTIAKVVYYRSIDKFLVYRTILMTDETVFVEKDNYSLCCNDDKEFSTLDELKRYYRDKFNIVEFYNLLSVDYVYLYKSGVCVEGSDLRTPSQILEDKIIHCLYTNGFLNEVLIHTKRFNCKFYRPFCGDYSDKNLEGWSYEVVDFYLEDSRLKLFLSSDTLFSFNKITKSIIINPIELLTELECSCVTGGNILSHCGDLGIQIS